MQLAPDRVQIWLSRVRCIESGLSQNPTCLHRCPFWEERVGARNPFYFSLNVVLHDPRGSGVP